MSFDGRIEALFTIPTGGAAMSVTTDAGGPTTVTIPAGEYYLTTTGDNLNLIETLTDELQLQRPPSSGGWSVALDTGADGTLRVSITCTVGTWSIAWTDTDLRDLLGFAANLTSVTGTQTATKQARGVWGPDCPLDLDGDPRMAPPDTDLRESMSPTGDIISLVNNRRFVHTGLVYAMVPQARYREASATYVNASWERFLEDTQHGFGHDWFRPSSKVQIYDHTGNLVGSDYNSGNGVSGWYMRGLARMGTRKASGSWTGTWRVEIPEITTSG